MSVFAKNLQGKGLNLVQNLILESTKNLLNNQGQQLISVPVKTKATLNRLFNAYEVAEQIKSSHQEGSLDILNAPGGLIQNVFKNFLRQGKLIPQHKNEKDQSAFSGASLQGVFKEFGEIGQGLQNLSKQLAQVVQGHLVQQKPLERRNHNNQIRRQEQHNEQQRNQQERHPPFNENSPNEFLNLIGPILRKKIENVNQSIWRADQKTNPIPVANANQPTRVTEPEDVEFVQRYIQPLYDPSMFVKDTLETKAKDYIRKRLPENQWCKAAFQKFYDPLVNAATNSQTYKASLNWLKQNVCDWVLTLPSKVQDQIKELEIVEKIQTNVDRTLNWLKSFLKQKQGPTRHVLQACEKILQQDVAKFVFSFIPVEPQVKVALCLVGAYTRIDFDAQFDPKALPKHVKEAYNYGKQLLGDNNWAKRLNKLENVVRKVQTGAKIVELIDYSLRPGSINQTTNQAGKFVNNLMREPGMMTKEEAKQAEIRELQQLEIKSQNLHIQSLPSSVQRPNRKQQSDPDFQNLLRTGIDHQVKAKRQYKQFWENKIDKDKSQNLHSGHKFNFEGGNAYLPKQIVPVPSGQVSAAYTMKGKIKARNQVKPSQLGTIQTDFSSGKYYTQQRINQMCHNSQKTTTRFVQGKDQLSKGQLLKPQKSFQKGNVLFKKTTTNQQHKANVEPPEQGRRILVPDSYFNNQTNNNPKCTKQKQGGRISKTLYKPDAKGVYSINTLDFYHSMSVDTTSKLQLAIPSELSYLSQNNDLDLIFCKKYIDGCLIGYERVEESLQKEESQNKKRAGMGSLSHEELRYKILGEKEEMDEFVVRGTYQILSENTFQIDSQKSYGLSGEVRSKHSMDVAIGLACFDQYQQIISSYKFSTKGSPVVYKSQNHKLREIQVQGDLSKWNFYPTNKKLGDRFLGFYFDGDTNKSPDDIITCDNDPTLENQTEAAFQWVDVKRRIIKASEFGYKQLSGKMVPGVTKIANHVYSQESPTLICTILESLQPSEAFQEFKVQVQGQGLVQPKSWRKDTIKSRFWPGTKFVKVVIYSNRLGYHKRTQNGELVWRNFNFKQLPQ